MSYALAETMWDAWTPAQRAQWAAEQSLLECALGYQAVADGNMPAAVSRFAASAILSNLCVDIRGEPAQEEQP